MNFSKNPQYTSNLSSDESEGRGHRKRKQKRFSDSEADGKYVQLSVPEMRASLGLARKILLGPVKN